MRCCALAFATIALLVGGCDRACTPGVSIACVGVAGCSGGQICNAEGSAFGFCDCGGAFDAGGGPVDAAVPLDVIPFADGSRDAGPLITDCDPMTHAECGPDQRCAWVRLGGGVGETRCVWSGATAEGGACAYGPDGDAGYDDCARDLTCVNDVCRPVCDRATPTTSCGSDAYCEAYPSLFAAGSAEPVAGACVATCDPLTRNPCSADQGCYEFGSSTSLGFTCAAAGSTAMGATVSGPVFVNSCVPGARAITNADGATLCVPYCRPVETHSGATEGESGRWPHRCEDVGGSSSDACLFSWLFSPVEYDARLDELGVCVPDGALTYDHDTMPATPQIAFPSCTTLSSADTDGDGSADHSRFGCSPRPAP